jgi:ketosteroid isomerase-like protein
MADSAPAAIAAAIEGYKAGNADQVLEQFADEALILGTRVDERWDTKESFAEPLRYELEHVEVDGPLTETGAEDVFARSIADDIAVYFRDGYLIFNGKRVHGRWTAIVRADAEGDWKIVHSHFSLAEGHTTFDALEST